MCRCRSHQAWKEKTINESHLSESESVRVRMSREMIQAAFAFAGNVLSLMIVRCIFKMGSPLKLTFLNQMFLIYFAIDAIIGSMEIYFLFQLKQER